ncbi:MAG TPA: hypothetical protein VMH92_01440 [Acidocella sp.]|nr:hypothetical protein [Acidocella sp.]
MTIVVGQFAGVVRVQTMGIHGIGHDLLNGQANSLPGGKGEWLHVYQKEVAAFAARRVAPITDRVAPSVGGY